MATRGTITGSQGASTWRLSLSAPAGTTAQWDAGDLVDILPCQGEPVVAAWLVASAHRRRRKVGFWVFLASNLLWIAWAWQVRAWALIVLQVGLAAMNIRGVRRNDA